MRREANRIDQTSSKVMALAILFLLLFTQRYSVFTSCVQIPRTELQTAIQSSLSTTKTDCGMGCKMSGIACCCSHKEKKHSVSSVKYSNVPQCTSASCIFLPPMGAPSSTITTQEPIQMEASPLLPTIVNSTKPFLIAKTEPIRPYHSPHLYLLLSSFLI